MRTSPVDPKKRARAKSSCGDAFDRQVARFLDSLEAQHYSRGMVKAYHRLLRAVGVQVRRGALTLTELNESVVVRLTERAHVRADERKYVRYRISRFMQFLCDQGVVAPQAPSLRADARSVFRREYEQYLREQRGLRESTIRTCWWLANSFLTFRFGQTKCGPFTALTAPDVADYLLHRHARGRSPRVKTTATHLRRLLQYLFQSGRTRTNLALAVPSVAHAYGVRLRRHLTPEQVERVLKAARSDPVNGQRNHAMLLLMARLGLRAPEVIALELDDIDWTAGEIVIRGKGLLHDRVPLSVDVGEALATYIRQDRECNCRAVFVAVRAPHRPFKDGQVLNTVLKQAMSRVGVKPPTPFVGSHVLRHSLAVELTRRGASLREIGEVLRHRSRCSTLLYARMDVEGLRSIAPPWPVTGGAG